MRREGDVFECEIQARLRDVNLGGHVDSVEAIRVLDEARLHFLRFAPLPALGDGAPGLLRAVPGGVADLVGAQRVDYHSEMRFVPFQPFLVRMWVSHVGGSSFSTATELRVHPDHAPALVAETTIVLWDNGAGSSWKLSDAVRKDMEQYAGAPVPLRDRPTG